MKCVICKHGDTAPGIVTVTLQRDETVIVVKDVPAEVCDQCGEYYLDEATTAKVLALGEDAVRHRAEVEVLRFVA
ncbi:type II toxin-antitoxin system MqsA family antitoxin [Acidithiobacillus sp. CV18-2]|nr:type II toxin-antitoxin system MqsA family antitoxin [Acidithiobacillus sp. CV18-3]MBU2756913.1 type II toxin-antitoxin system MqsA family antitoxin [Acidithiobacillus sp. BN09-2]MBU2777989.1 type II toxin-antitoxin system MqsA family antitoxin [Acidithiobacillus sp. CV18-2]MBU2799624.1 type II toxin-antitoxin system MqsA family antitoxin [Acidithiobacillus sp. VAN18-4]